MQSIAEYENFSQIANESPNLPPHLREAVLKLAEIEEVKARRRQEATQLAGKDKNGNPLFKSSVVGQEPPTEPKGKIHRNTRQRRQRPGD
ncbi:MAG: hypothetical protein ACXQS7_05625 [Candidatus Syntropharchaeia archaeon]